MLGPEESLPGRKTGKPEGTMMVAQAISLERPEHARAGGDCAKDRRGGHGSGIGKAPGGWRAGGQPGAKYKPYAAGWLKAVDMPGPCAGKGQAQAGQ